MTFLIFALSHNGARRNDVFNCFPFSSVGPTFINDRLQTAYVFSIISCIYNTILYKYITTEILITEMGVSNEAKNVIPLKFLRKIKFFFFSCELDPVT
jgi:hypothetical protein